MVEKKYRSKCCDAKVRVAGGMPDFWENKEICTFYFSCLRCGKPCNTKRSEEYKRKIHAIKRLKKRLDFQGEVLQKLVKLLDGITIDPVKGVILTPKKKRQLAEVKEMEQKLFGVRVKKPRG